MTSCFTASGPSTYRYRCTARVNLIAPRSTVANESRASVKPPARPTTVHPQAPVRRHDSPSPSTPPVDKVRLFLNKIDAGFSSGGLSSRRLNPPTLRMEQVSCDQYKAIQSLVHLELPASSAAKVAKLDYCDGRLFITFPSQAHEIMSGVIEYIRDQMWEQGFYWETWSDIKDRIQLSKSMSTYIYQTQILRMRLIICRHSS